MIHVLGYIALALNLTSMSMKNVLYLRVLSFIANFLYIFYGIILHSPPLVIGCSIAVSIHGFHIFKLLKSKKIKKSLNTCCDSNENELKRNL